MKVLFAASEVNPIIKSGGLADVIGALPQELVKQGVDVRIAMPDYPAIDNKQFKYINRPSFFSINLPTGKIECWVSQIQLPGTDIPVYLFKTSRGLSASSLYPEVAEGDQDRFLLFNIAVVEWLKTANWQPDIVHCHDWMTGAIPQLIQQHKLSYATLLTIHNLFYQGLTPVKYFSDYNIQLYNQVGSMVNMLRLGINTANYISTVSPTYAIEALTPEYGCGLEQSLKKRQSNFRGILNGVNYEQYSPSFNHNLAESYTVANVSKAKKQNKIQLLADLGIDGGDNLPLYGYVGRLTDQKGLDLIESAVQSTPLLEHGRLIILGKGESYWERRLATLAKSRNGKMVVKIKFDEKLAHQIYAASDFFLIPSRFEPCGLTQLIAMKYGSLPIARKTGGLADTVLDLRQNPRHGTGIVFEDYNIKALSSALGGSIGLFNSPKQMAQAIQNAMTQNFSWEQSARQYMEIYRSLGSK